MKKITIIKASIIFAANLEIIQGIIHGTYLSYKCTCLFLQMNWMDRLLSKNQEGKMPYYKYKRQTEPGYVYLVTKIIY